MYPSLKWILPIALAFGAGMTVSSSGPRPAFVVNGVERAVDTASAQASKVMDFDATINSLDWTQTTPGVDGIGAGNDVFRIAVTVNGVTVCYLDVACDGPQNDYSTTCASAAFVSGDDVDVRAVTAPCQTPPIGFPAFSATQ